MKTIKGPKSALSDFIKESNIKISGKKRIESNEEPFVKEMIKKQKKVKYSKPFELVNFETIKSAEADKIIEDILENIDNTVITDQLLKRIATYLSRKRRMSTEFFNFLVDKCKDSLTIYDCSMIKDADFIIPKKLKSLELFQCGQLTEETLNCILSQMDNLEVLRITGAFLLETFNIPPTLHVLDVSNCSRLKNTFIDSINLALGKLDELRLSFCYGFTAESELCIEITHLFICETRFNESFYSRLKNLKTLSIKRCPNIDTVSEIEGLEYLDVEGIVTLTQLPPSSTLLHLNITDCVQIKDLNFPNLKSLHMANTRITQDHINQISGMKHLKELDISWNTFINDAVFENLASELSLEKILVFGCFGLSKKSVDFAYKNSNSCQIIGNPSETRYLLDESI